MAGKAPDLGFGLCPERESLGRAYLHAIHELNEMIAAQAEMLIHPELKFDRLELALSHARKKRSSTKAAYVEHIQAHGC